MKLFEIFVGLLGSPTFGLGISPAIVGVWVVNAPTGWRSIAINECDARGVCSSNRTWNDGANGRQERGEVAVTYRHRRNALRSPAGCADFGAFISPKEKQFVFLDWTAQSSTVLVKDILWFHRLHDSRPEIIACAKMIVRVVLVSGAVKLI